MLDPSAAAAAWQIPGPLRAAPDQGLINQTWLVGDPPAGVLQWLNPIFSPKVNLDIQAVTDRLAQQGMCTPRLIPTAQGAPWLDDQDGCWRMLSFVPGSTQHRLHSPALAHEAGRLVGAFHRALDGWVHPQHAPRRDVHHTPSRMADLATALETADGHPLEAPARQLGAAILGAWSAWEGTIELPERTCHGDLKISNLRFDEEATQGRCLIDLDTVGPMALSCELGDAWRSWCNPAGEDDPEAVHFDLNIFAASLAGFAQEAPPLEPIEVHSLVPGIERICMELAARFCADALQNAYFREDRARFPQVGAHNLHRAQAQFNLSVAARAARPGCQEAIQRLLPSG